MATKEMCQRFISLKDNIIENYHLVPLNALYDTMKYHAVNKGKQLKVSEVPGIKAKIEEYETKLEDDDLSDSRKSSYKYRIRILKRKLTDYSRSLDKNVISIANYEIQSNWDRMFVIDLKEKSINSFPLAHGKGGFSKAHAKFMKSGYDKSAPDLETNKIIKNCKNSVKDSKGNELLPKVLWTSNVTRSGFYYTGGFGKWKRKISYTSSLTLRKGRPLICRGRNGKDNQHFLYKTKGGNYRCKNSTSKYPVDHLSLVGLESSNNEIWDRAVVMHGRQYVGNYGEFPKGSEYRRKTKTQERRQGYFFTGRSHGCFAISQHSFPRIIDQVYSDESTGSLLYSYVPQCLPENDNRKRKGTFIEDMIAKKELVTYEKIESLIKVEGYPVSLRKFRKYMKQYLDKKNLAFVTPTRRNKSIKNLKDKKLIGVMAYYLEINKYVKSRLSITTRHYHDYIVLLSEKLKEFNKSLNLDTNKIDARVKTYLNSCKQLIDKK